MCVSCYSICQVIGYRKTPLRTPIRGKEIISTKPKLNRVFVWFSFSLFMLLSVLPALPNTYCIRRRHDTAYTNQGL